MKIKKLLLRAEEDCNTFKRHFKGAKFIELKEKGHIDDLMNDLINKFNDPSIFNAYNPTQLIIQNLTINFYKPLFVLEEDKLVNDLKKINYVKTAMVIPSGRNPSNNEISQTYLPINDSCK